MIICKFDNTEHKTIEDFHKYLRRFKITQEAYYTEYSPRYDKLTGEPIKFKNYDQYFSRDFNTKVNQNKWIKLNPEEGLKWSIEKLKERKEKKNLKYTLSEVELRILSLPSIKFFENNGGYENINKEIGLINRFNIKKPISQSIKGDKIIFDTREKLPLKFKHETLSEKLDYGDYALASNRKIVVERKSLSDMVGTLSSRKISNKSGDDSAFLRFDRELQRATEDNGYVIMVVETTLTTALSFNYQLRMGYTKVSPSHIFKNLRDLLVKYPLNFQILFTKGRIDAAEKVVKIFEMSEDVRGVDLQYYFD